MSEQETTWWWRLEGADGVMIEPAPERMEFPTRGDAESYIGESYAELADGGVASVTLFEDEREVYGPMSLSAES